MLEEFILEDPGEGIHEVEIREVLVSSGDKINEGDNVFVVESDKAVVELPSPFTGQIEDIRFQVGDTATVGDILLTVESDTGPDDSTDDGNGRHDESRSGRTKEIQTAEASREEDEADQSGQNGDGQPETVRDQDPTDDRGGNRNAARSGSADGPSGPEAKTTKTKAAPAARRLAEENGLELADIEATGSHGHVTRDDVERAAGKDVRDQEQAKPRRKQEKPPQTASAGGTGKSRDRRGEEERQPLRSLRRATARRMATAWSEIPHVMHQDEADITELEALRKRLQPQAEEQGGKLTLSVFMLKALTAALQKHPRFNASLDTESEEIVLKHFWNINVALDSDRGLIAPVLRDVDRMSMLDLSVALKELAERVRGGDASKDDLSHGTFTLTNVGSLGGTAFSPIINYPQVAILGMARAHLAQRVTGDISNPQVQTRVVQPLVVAFDHRVVDGADAARFLNDIVAMLADPEQFLLRLS